MEALVFRIRNRCLFDPRDPGWPGSGSGMNNRDPFFECLENFFGVKILKFFDADPGSLMERIQLWDPGWKN